MAERFIDANEAKKALKAVGNMMGCEVLDTIPTADAERIIRCQDCKFTGNCGERTNLEVMGFYGYCSRAKRYEREVEKA